MTIDEGTLAEIIVLGNDSEPGRLRVSPDRLVVRPVETEIPDVSGIRIEIGQPLNQPMREVLIEE